MAKQVVFTIDVEPDLYGSTYKGVTEGLKKFEVLCDRFSIKPILFVTTDCIVRYPSLFKRWHNKGWEISLHGLTHNRFDEMTLSEKKYELSESIRLFKKHVGAAPKGFRAPQHSIDEETLDLLEKYGIHYDSSMTPLNLLQFFFFPHKRGLWARSFLSRRNPYLIRKNLWEIPPSSLLLPFVSLVLRVLPRPLLKLYVSMIVATHQWPIFYAHSWDFIKLNNSRIDKAFSHTRFLKNLEYIMSIVSRHNNK